MNKFETRLLIVDNWFRKEKPLGPGKKGTFEKQTQMTKELKEIVKNVDFYLFDISMLDNYDYNFRDREILSEIFNQMKRGAIHYIWWVAYDQAKLPHSGNYYWNGHGVGQSEEFWDDKYQVWKTTFGIFNNKSLFCWLWYQNFYMSNSATSREKHRLIARSLLINIFETYMIYISEFKYSDGSSPNLTEQQKSVILDDIYKDFSINLLGECSNMKIVFEGICHELDDYKESN